jgi:hypothetical protein
MAPRLISAGPGNTSPSSAASTEIQKSKIRLDFVHFAASFSTPAQIGPSHTDFVTPMSFGRLTYM